MPDFLSVALEWFRARTGIERALIAALALVLLAGASRVVSVLALFLFVVAAGAFVVQGLRRRPVQGWVFAALGSLAAAVVFSVLAGAIYGPVTPERQPAVERAAQPATEEEPDPPERQGGPGVSPRPETPTQPPEDRGENPEYSIVDVSVGGPGNTVSLTVLAPEVRRGEEVAGLAAAEYAERDYVRVLLYSSREDIEERSLYASATAVFSERGAQRTGLQVGEMSYERR